MSDDKPSDDALLDWLDYEAENASKDADVYRAIADRLRELIARPSTGKAEPPPGWPES